MPDTESKAASASTSSGATVSPAFLKTVLERSTEASNNAVTQMAKALEALTAVMAEKQAPAAAAAKKERDLHDRKVPDFW